MSVPTPQPALSAAMKRRLRKPGKTGSGLNDPVNNPSDSIVAQQVNPATVSTRMNSIKYKPPVQGFRDK